MINRTKSYSAVYSILFKGLMLLVLVAVLVGNGGMLLRLQKPWGGFITQWYQSENAYRIIPATNPAAPGLQNGTILPGDTIVEIVGQDITQQGLNEIYATMYWAGERKVTYILERGGAEVQADGPLLLFTFQDYLDQQLPLLLIGLSAWLLAWIVFKAAPQQESNRAFALLGLGTCAIMTGGNYEFSGQWHVLGIVITMFTMIAFWPLIGASLFHFAVTFPKPSTHFGKWGQWTYLPAIIAVVFYEYATWQVARSTPLYASIDRAVFAFGGVTAILGMLTLIIRSLHILFHPHSSRKKRRQTLLIALGFIIGVAVPAAPYVLFTIAPQWYYPIRKLNYPLLGTFLILSVGYAILRYQTFQSRQRTLLTLVMLGLSILLAQALLILTLLVWGKIPRGYSWMLLQIIITAILSTQFWQGQHSINHTLNRLLRRECNQYNIVSAFIQPHAETQTETALAEHFLTILGTEFEARYAILWRYENNVPVFPPLIYRSSYALQLALDKMLPSESLTLKRVADPCCPKSSSPEAVSLSLHHDPGAAPQIFGRILLGARWTEEIYDEDDLELLHMISKHITATLLTTRYIARLREEPRRVLAVQEHERDRLAQELHDTVQQELGALPFYLESIQVSLENTPATTELFEKCYALIEHAFADLQEIRHNLAPAELRKLGLHEALQYLLQHQLTHTQIHATLKYNLTHNLDETRSRALYRILQQALTNSIQHAQAKHIHIVLREQNNIIHAKIEDDGCGFELQDLTTLHHAGHDGLYGMHNRVQALNGTLKINSRPQQGTQIEIALPVNSTRPPNPR